MMSGPGRSDEQHAKRRRGLGVVAGVVVVLLVAGGGAGYLLGKHSDRQAQQKAAEATARGYLAAWATADYAGMAAASTGTPAQIGALDAADRTGCRSPRPPSRPGP